MRTIGLMTILLVAGCPDDAERPLGEPCVGDSDCADGLDCQYGRCREGCVLDGECGADGACAATAEDPAERVCVTVEDASGRCPAPGDPEGCAEGLSCGPDGLCREPCQPADDCGGSRVCALGHCMDAALAGPYCDADGDEFFDTVCTGQGCSRCGDCDDGDPTVNPDAEETCDGRDTDCRNGAEDDEVDDDADGVLLCAGDCDDADGALYPGAEEVCDGLDNDCDGSPLEGEVDGDGDGVMLCAGDCDDADETVAPGAPEVCDGLDDDCDGLGETPIAPLGEPRAIGDQVLEVVGPALTWTDAGYAVGAAWRDDVGWWLGLYVVPAEGEASLAAVAPSVGALTAPQVVWAGDRFLVVAVDVDLGHLLVIEVVETAGAWTQVVTEETPDCDPAPGRLTDLSLGWDGVALGLALLELTDDARAVVCLAELDPLTRLPLATLALTPPGEVPTAPVVAPGAVARRWLAGWVNAAVEGASELVVVEADLEAGEVAGLARVSRTELWSPRMVAAGGGAGALWFQTETDAPALRFALATPGVELVVDVEGSPAPDEDNLADSVAALAWDGAAYLAAWYAANDGGQLRLGLRPADRPGPWPTATLATGVASPPGGLALAAADQGWGVAWRARTGEEPLVTEGLFLVVADGCH
jgi:hypothetical protein